jgi:hypothetical protein
MRENNNGDMPRQPGDIPCGGLPNMYKLSELARRLKLQVNQGIIEQLYHIHRAISHIEHAEIPRYEIVEQNNETNSDLRIQYMLKELDETSWKSTLQKREKKNMKHTEISQILQMFLDTAADIFRTIIDVDSDTKINQHIETLQSLRAYSNTSLEKISQRYSCVVPHIFDDWIINNIKK